MTELIDLAEDKYIEESVPKKSGKNKSKRTKRIIRCYQ